ncbi:MAG: hypothetical protein JRG72_10625 [Deltaproteobacteria bacterium]|nr:hypothetical protein [Deltaproteobacteria bacterium]
MRYLVVMDIPGIKEYVFGTDRLVEIRGASALLDHLNRDEVKSYLEQHLGLTEVKCVFAGGGAGQFIIDAKGENELHHTLRGLKGKIFKESKGGLRFVSGIADLSDNSYKLALDTAFLKLRKEKEGYPFDSVPIYHTGYIRECDSCSGMAAKFCAYGDETRVLCETCARKEEYGKKRGLWKEFAGYLQGQGINEAQALNYRPQNFEEIGKRCQAREGYTALVYADGNAMGKLIKEINDPNHYRVFSATVDRAIRQACHEALAAHCPERQGKIPADILLLGGDDLLVYLSADTALPFALDVAQKFNEKTQHEFSQDRFFKELLQNQGLTVSLGIAYGRSHTPFRIMFNQAEELLKSAKRAGSEDDRAQGYFSPTYIDYHFSSYFNQVKVENCRQQHLQLQAAKLLRLYQKPYSLEDARKLLDYARSLNQIGIPRTRLKRLGQIPALGKLNGTLEFLKFYVRTRQDEHKRAIYEALDYFGCAQENIPWKETDTECTTVLGDLIELTEFIASPQGFGKGE